MSKEKQRWMEDREREREGVSENTKSSWRAEKCAVAQQERRYVYMF